MSQCKTAAVRTVLSSCAMLFAGCGGGGGGGSGSPNPPPATYTVGGTVSGLAGGSVALRLNGGADLIVATNGAFTFPGVVNGGSAYTVSVQTQPAAPAQTCALANATGNLNANVNNVAVTCTTNTYRVGGMASGLAGGTVFLRLNGGQPLAVSANGEFQFDSAVASGATYDVTVHAHPVGLSQNCAVTQGSGTIGAANVSSVGVNCTINSFAVGGTVSGLTSQGLVLRNNGGNDLVLNANGEFAFSSHVPSGGSYLVTVHAQPAANHCTVANGTGNVQDASVNGVTVTCVEVFSIGGTVSGLDVGGLVLRNSGSDDLTVNGNGTFAFATRVPLGTPYLVTAVAGTPASPRHVCQVTNGSGTLNSSANVTDIEVACEADRFAYVAHSSTASFDGPGLISALTMNHQTGALAPISVTPTIAAPNGAVQIVADPRGRFIYVAHTAVFTAQGSVAGYSVNPATGALTPVPGSPFASGMATNSLAIDSEGLFLYATNRNSDDVSGWAIQPNGSLTPVPGSPFRIGDAAAPASVATTPAQQCCSVYVAHSNAGGVPHVSAYTYDQFTGALTPLPGSPFSAGPGTNSPSSLQVNTTGEHLYMAHSGTSNITTFDIAGGAGTLTERPGSPSPALNSPCFIHQPRLSLSIFVVSSLSYQLGLFGADVDTYLPTWMATETMFAGSYCSVASDPYGQFMYVPKFDDVADYLFGFRLGTDYVSLQPLTLNPVAPTNTYTLPAQKPRSMVIRYSRRDRETLQVPD